MQVNGQTRQSIWYEPEINDVWVIDQRKLPFRFELVKIKTLKDAFDAIDEMIVRGAPLIGVTAGYGLYLGISQQTPSCTLAQIKSMGDYLKSSRPTAVNLAIVIDDMIQSLEKCSSDGYSEEALRLARNWEQRELDNCSKIGDFGLSLIEQLAKAKNEKTVNILTHCNAGWLACVDWGTATAPIYKAHLNGIKVHVWVDETRPRNQGARLTAWELEQTGVPYTVIPDNTGGHLMQHGLVDMVIVGSDRTTRNGDVANKIGTYLKALAAYDNNIPFYVALPSSSIDFNMTDGLNNIPIEQRHPSEVTQMEVQFQHQIITANLMPERTPVANYGFDVTPARLVTRLITERGICEANETGITRLFSK
ncbi:MAG: S-methyl-5-thioribose-1-phosphate isomerase [Salinivirgaceae bacterium]